MPGTYAMFGAQADGEITALKATVVQLQANAIEDQLTIESLTAQLEAARPEPTYGPVRITDIAELDPPDTFNYVPWRWSQTTPLQDAFAQLGDRDVLVLPEDTFLIDTAKGFRRDARHDVAMARTRAGIIGMGPGTVITLGPSSFSQPAATGTAGNRNKAIECWTPNGILANFTMRGRDLGGVAFDAIKGAAPDIRMERLLLQGAHRGTSAAPPNEAGGLVNHKAPRMVIRRCEIDCRDHNGIPAGSSPIMLNVSDDCLIEDVYAHHALTGAPTAWNLTNLTTRRLRSEFNSSGFNHELVQGTVIHEDATFIIDRAGRKSNRGSHLSIGTNRGSAKYLVSLAEWDAGHESAPASVFVQNLTTAYLPYSQRDADIQVSQVARPRNRPVPVLYAK